MLVGVQGASLLITVAVSMRLSGSAARSSDVPLARFPGWLLCALGVWLAVGAAGGFAPLLAGVALGLLLAFFGFTGPRWLLWIGGDIALVSLAAWLSIPGPGVARAAVIATLIAGAGILIDATLNRVAPVVRVGVFALPLVVWSAAVVAAPDGMLSEAATNELRAAVRRNMAITVAQSGRRIVLDTGAVAWLDLPASPPPYRGALFFHGRSSRAAHDRGAVFIRRALVGLGFAVLAVDHPAYLDSPTPAPGAEFEEWDPLPTSTAALGYLESLPDVQGRTIVVGHSMGATEVLRLLATRPRLGGGIVLGATVAPPPEDEMSFYRRFHRDRGMEPRSISQSLVRRILETYYNNDVAAQALPDGHAPILFLRFRDDFSNIIEGRRQLFEMIPGSKASWQLASDHYFRSAQFRGLVVADHLIMRRLQRGIQRFMEGRHPGTGRELPFGAR